MVTSLAGCPSNTPPDEPPAELATPEVTPAPTPRPVDPQVEVASFVHRWAVAWEGNSVATASYRVLYGSDFHSEYKAAGGMDHEQWVADKEAKARRASCIQVGIEKLDVALTSPTEATASFDQRYVSNTWCDEGRKTLSLRKVGEDWKIVGEEQPASTKCADRCGLEGEARFFVGYWYGQVTFLDDLEIRTDGTFVRHFTFECPPDAEECPTDATGGTWKVADGQLALFYAEGNRFGLSTETLARQNTDWGTRLQESGGWNTAWVRYE